jgi:hypothetical protein
MMTKQEILTGTVKGPGENPRQYNTSVTVFACAMRS